MADFCRIFRKTECGHFMGVGGDRAWSLWGRVRPREAIFDRGGITSIFDHFLSPASERRYVFRRKGRGKTLYMSYEVLERNHSHSDSERGWRKVITHRAKGPKGPTIGKSVATIKTTVRGQF